VKLIKKDGKYIAVMDDGTEYQVDDNKLTKANRNRIHLQHQHTTALLGKLGDVEDALKEVEERLAAIEEALK